MTALGQALESGELGDLIEVQITGGEPLRKAKREGAMAWLSGADPGKRTAMADGRTFVLADPDCCRCREFGDTRLRYGLPDGDYVLRAVLPGYVLPEHVQAIEQSSECGHAVLAMVGGGKRHTSLSPFHAAMQLRERRRQKDVSPWPVETEPCDMGRLALRQAEAEREFQAMQLRAMTEHRERVARQQAKRRVDDARGALVFWLGLLAIALIATAIAWWVER